MRWTPAESHSILQFSTSSISLTNNRGFARVLSVSPYTRIALSLRNSKSNGLRLSFSSHPERIIHAIAQYTLAILFDSAQFYSSNPHLSQTLHQWYASSFCYCDMCFTFKPLWFRLLYLVSLLVSNRRIISVYLNRILVFR